LARRIILWRGLIAAVRQGRKPAGTVTIDYDLIFSGAVTMYLDIGEVDLTAGDIIIQRTTLHAWHNYAAEPCMLFAMVIRV
jgi:hypothetical protein